MLAIVSNNPCCRRIVVSQEELKPENTESLLLKKMFFLCVLSKHLQLSIKDESLHVYICIYIIFAYCGLTVIISPQ